jgi:uncharacterized membrane protein YdjX (TVP38/TMEM64 family)
MSLGERLNRWASGDDGPKKLGRVLLPALVLLSLASFFVVGAVFDLEGERIQSFMTSAATSPISLFVVIAVFVGFGLMGTPQFLLITVTGAVLPPLQAFGYVWVATLISATLHFYMGRQFSTWIGKASGPRVNTLKSLLSRHGLVSSAIVRNVPAGPFIFVNVVCGASGMRGYNFLIGTALGIIPKAGALIFLGVNLSSYLKEPSPEKLAILIVVIGSVALISMGLSWIVGKFTDQENSKDT